MSNETQQDLSHKDLYYVAVKLFLRDGHKLLITPDIYGSWDLPGGRLIKSEFSSPLEAVIKRKISEELGDKVRYELGAPKTFFRVERMEAGLNKRVRIFGLGYEAAYKGGEIKLWQHHDQMQWVDIRQFKPEDYFTTGWLEGVQDYLAKCL